MDVNGKMGIKKLSEGGKQAERDARPDFRVEVAGSTPAGPITKQIDPIEAKISTRFLHCFGDSQKKFVSDSRELELGFMEKNWKASSWVA